jgi:hypothetical protein
MMKKSIIPVLAMSICYLCICANTLAKQDENKSSSTVYYVGPGRSYKQLQDIAALLMPGDTVYVDGNTTYPGSLNLTKPGTQEKRITIRGIKVNGRRPVINGGVYGIRISGSYYTFEGFEVTGTTHAGVGHFADEIIVRDFIIHDNTNEGLIGYGSNSGTLTLEYSEFYHNGRSPRGHQIYMSTDEVAYPNARFRLQFCYIHDANGGNNVKSRSGINEIYYNWIEGAVYHGLEIIGQDLADNKEAREDTKREDSDVVGNVIFVSRGMSGARVGGDGTGQSWGRYRFVNNTFILNGNSDVLRGYTGVQSIEMHNNVIYNRISPDSTGILDDERMKWSDSRHLKGSNNWIQSGTPSIPPEFRGTIIGSDPGFINLNANVLHLTSKSALINKGNPSPETFTDFPFPNGLSKVAFHPPFHVLLPVNRAEKRPSVGKIDIGAFEYHK